MGFISRRVFPACESMCVCCPALRSRSRQPVKRYKKLLAEIFPKSADGPPNERKIVKLCEYAAKNPFRIPKIVKYLEEKFYKELRSEHAKFINIVIGVYDKLLCMCKGQMVYFALSLLSIVTELLVSPKQDSLQILGCQTLTKFINGQSDSTYAHNIEKFVHQVCVLAQEGRGGGKSSVLRASSLQCLSAMVRFMVEFSIIFDGFDEIVRVILVNHEPDLGNEDVDERAASLHNWVDEVVRSEGRGAGESSPNSIVVRRRPDIKDPSLLTKEEIETPEVWARIGIQRMAELAKESITSTRRVLDPMFAYFDSGCHWIPLDGLALIVLSDMSYMLESAGNQQLILASVVRHLDHKNITHDLWTKSCVIRVATALAKQIRISGVLTEIGLVSDLCRHLRKSLQATVNSTGEQESTLNYSLQTSIEDCLVEIAKGIGDVRPLFDLMTIMLEKIPSPRGVARATMGSVMILAHMISLVSVSSQSQKAFPEALLIQILQVMLHPDVEVRVRAHHIFSVLLVPNSSCPRNEASFVRVNCPYDSRRWESSTASALASISSRLEKLRKEKNGITSEKQGHAIQDDFKATVVTIEDGKQGFACKNSPNFCKISVLEKVAGSACLSELEPHILKFSEDQINQLLSAFWIQANLPDNLPSNFEAIANSFILTLLSSRLMNPSKNLVIRFIHLLLSLRTRSLDANAGMLPSACQRSMFTLATGMLLFMAKLYQIQNVIDLLKSVDPCNVDPYLGITEDFQVYVRPQVDLREYGSASDNEKASFLLLHLRSKTCESDSTLLNMLAGSLCSITEVDREDLVKQLSEAYKPEDAFVFGPQLMLDLDNNQMVFHSKKSLSFDEDVSANSSFEDDTVSEASVSVQRMPPTPSFSDLISVGKLMETALEVAGQVAGSTVSTSPLPYSAMASQCEALGAGPRRKLSNWLAQDNSTERSATDKPRHMDGCTAIRKITGDTAYLQGDMMLKDRCLAMKLPPASPFDNFLKAAGC